MSGSPKYSRAELDRRRQAELADKRRRREEAARRKQEKKRLARVQAERSRLEARRTTLVRAVSAQSGDAARAGESGRHAALTDALAGLAGTLAGASGEAELAKARAGLDDAERRSAELAVAVSTRLARSEHAAALAQLDTVLDAAADRAELDPAGAREVTAARAAVRGAMGDRAGFPAAWQRLETAVAAHLEAARNRRDELARARRAAARAHEDLAGLCAEIGEAEAALDGADAAADLLRALSAGADAGDVPETERLVASAGELRIRLTAAFEAWLDELACAEIVMAAVGRALPAAGLQVDPGSVEQIGTGVMVTARRASGDRIVLAVQPDGDGGAQLVYEGEGHDFVTRVSAAGGEEKSCDLTVEILERFQSALEPEGVIAGELGWSGKPERPDARTAKQFPGAGERGR